MARSALSTVADHLADEGAVSSGQRKRLGEWRGFSMS
jgi:hypothetical protein